MTNSKQTSKEVSKRWKERKNIQIEFSVTLTCTVYASLGLVSGTTIRTRSPAGVLETNTQWSPTTSMSLTAVPEPGANKGTQDTMDGSERGVCTT